MATRCTINIQNEDGSVDGIYCHSDGYPEGVGKILLKHYNTEEKIRELIDLGNLSFLGTTTQFSSDPNDDDKTRDYHRWRGEPKNINHYENINDLMFQIYNYLWKDDMWWVRKENQTDWVPLDQIILENFYPSLDQFLQ